MKHPNRDLARKLRSSLTDSEQFVWKRLRHKQLGGHRFRRQFPLGSYIVDFICLEKRLIIELDGGQHAERTQEDDVRTQWLNSEGYMVLRFWNHIALTEWDSVEEQIWRSFQQSPPP